MKRQELSPGLACGWQKPSDLNHCLQGSIVAGGYGQESEPELTTESTYSDMGILSADMKCQAKCPPSNVYF